MLYIFQRPANRRAMIFLTILYILFPALILPYAEAPIKGFSGGVGPIELQFTYTPTEVFAMIATYGEAGRTCYRLIELTAALHRALPTTSWVQQIPRIGRAILLVDFVENAGIVFMLTQFPAQNSSLAFFTSMITTTKWVLFGTSPPLFTCFSE